MIASFDVIFVFSRLWLECLVYLVLDFPFLVFPPRAVWSKIMFNKPDSEQISQHGTRFQRRYLDWRATVIENATQIASKRTHSDFSHTYGKGNENFAWTALTVAFWKGLNLATIVICNRACYTFSTQATVERQWVNLLWDKPFQRVQTKLTITHMRAIDYLEEII